MPHRSRFTPADPGRLQASPVRQRNSVSVMNMERLHLVAVLIQPHPSIRQDSVYIHCQKPNVLCLLPHKISLIMVARQTHA
jgi:hypothetical protein